MNKDYRLIVDGSYFSLSNDTDSDIMSDYSPGIWAIKTQKRALKYAQELLAGGDTVTVETYKNPKNAPLANKFIKELGLKQPLFAEVAPIPKTVNYDNLKIKTLADLKRYLQVGVKVKITNTGYQGVVSTRETEVMKVQSNAITLAKDASLPKDRWQNSWLEFGKASDWGFTMTGATKYYIDREGRVPSTTIEYINN